MSGHGPVLDLGGSFADHHLRGDMGPGGLAGPGPRNPQRPPRAQACDQLTLERTPAFDVERLIDGLVADAHGLIIGEIDTQPVRDLLGTPALGPAAVPTMRLVAALPLRANRPQGATAGRPNRAREPLLHIAAKPIIAGELRWPRTTSAPLCVPLRDRRLVLKPECSRRRVPAKLPRDRRRAAIDPAGDLTHTEALGPEQRDVLTLSKRQIPARHRRGQTWVHPASVAEPPEPNGG